MVECFYVVELILDSNWFILDFYRKFVHLKLLFFALHAFKFFLSEDELTKHTR